MGIACNDVNVNDLSDDAQTQLELALSRGGDQVVVKKIVKLYFLVLKRIQLLKNQKLKLE